MKDIRKVLASYNIYPKHIKKISSHLFKITDEKGTYALKKSSLSDKDIQSWLTVYHEAQIKQLTQIMPVYITKKNKLYQQINGVIYYLSPWIHHEEYSIKMLYHSLGHIHQQTKQKAKIESKQIIKTFNDYKKYCEQIGNKLLGYLNDFESKHYMSPLELQVCTHYHHLEFALKESIRRIDVFTIELSEQASWSYSLCHGNLKLTDIVGENIINWEKTSYNNAITDFVCLFNNGINHVESDVEQWINLFPTYMELNKLTTLELSLLAIHLLDVSLYIQKLDQYITNQREKSMIVQIQHLDTVYRKLLFGIKWTQFIKNEYELFSIEK